MIFARYKSVERDGLTPGKVYVAKPDMDEEAVVGFEHVEIVDDNGIRVRFKPQDGQFEYMQEVYAVVARPFDELKTGEVVVVDDAVANGGLLYSVQGTGLRSAADLIILDRTNVFPGIVVQDVSTGKWVRVSKVDQANWIAVAGGDDFRSPEEFRFSVADGDILVVPMVECIDDAGQVGLTKGRLYYIRRTEPDGGFVVADDQGVERSYMASRFKMGN